MSLLEDGLRDAPSLRSVTFPGSNAIPVLHRITKNPSLQQIRLIQLSSPHPNQGTIDFRTLYSHVDQPLRDLIVFHPETSNGPPNISLPSNPLFVPMAHVDQNIRDTIWGYILYFSLQVDVYKDGTCLSPQMLEQLTRTRTSVPQVSKEFQVS
jgi:hypothetical protein